MSDKLYLQIVRLVSDVDSCPSKVLLETAERLRERLHRLMRSPSKSSIYYTVRFYDFIAHTFVAKAIGKSS